MKRIRISQILAGHGALLGQEIVVKGWVRAFRSNRFVQLNDGSCMANLQAVIDFEQWDEALLKRITTASALSLKGNLVASQGAGQLVELQVTGIEILGDAHPDDVQKTVMQPKRHSLDFLREQAHLRFRTNTFGAVFRIRHAILSRNTTGGDVMRRTILHGLAVIALSISATVSAQNWPQRPVRVVVPYAPGGQSDTVMRLLIPRMAEFLGQNIIVENRSGGGGTAVLMPALTPCSPPAGAGPAPCRATGSRWRVHPA